METVAEVWKETTETGIDLGALIVSAIKEKQEQEARKYETVEQPPKGAKLTWKVTPEEIAEINAGNAEIIDKFYMANIERVRYSAYRFMRNNNYVKAVASYEDLMQQFYIDLRTGAVKLRPFDIAIGYAVFHSFRYAPVGGFDEIYIPLKDKEQENNV